MSGVLATARLVRSEASYARKTLLRDPQSAFFTVGLPLLYLFIFNTVFGNEIGRTSGQPGTMRVAIIMTASVLVIGVVSAAFQNLAVSLVQDREHGILKRLRSTPVPTPVFLAGHLLNALLVSVVLAVGVATLGILAYGVPVPRLPAAIVTLLVGTCACAGAALPFTLLVRKASAAAPVGLAVTLTLFFLSGSFFPGQPMPHAMEAVADVFPVRHFFVAMLSAFNPNTTGAGFEPTDLLVLAGWAVGGGLVGARFFRWTPTADG